MEAMKKRLEKIESPFIWGMNEIKEVIDNHVETRGHDDEDYVPILKWMRALVQVYESIVKKNLTEAKESLKLAEETWESVKIKHSADISLNVLDNIYKGTKCYLALEEDKLEEIEKILKTLKTVDINANPKEKSTLNGCKSIAWSKYKDAGKSGIRNALQFANMAIKDNPNCDVWHFLAGKNLRRQRRLENFGSHPTDKEVQEFKKAFELSNEPTFGIYLATMYKEKQDKYNALKIYEIIYNSKPESANIQLRLALGFIRGNKLELAKKCLDYAEEKVPDDSMFLHYKGIYFEKKKCYSEAAAYFLKACEGHNFPAEMSYLKCQSEMGKSNFNFVEYLEKMLKNYATYEGRDLDIMLQLAVCYYLCNHDIRNAAKYYLQAMEKYPNDKMFQNHICVLGGKTNIYQFLRTDFLPKALAQNLDIDTKEMCQKLKEHCDKNYRSQRKEVELNFNKMRLH